MKSILGEIIDWIKGSRLGSSPTDKLVILTYILNAVIVMVFLFTFFGKEKTAEIIFKRPNLINWIPAKKVLVKIDGILLSLPVIIDYMVFIKLDWEKKEREFAKNLSSNDGSIIDIGASLGHYTAFLAKKNPKSKIISVEASPTNFNLLKSNCKLNNLNNIVLYNRAIFDKDDEIIEFFERKSLSAIHLQHLEALHIPLEQIKKETVRTMTIDRLIEMENLEDITLLKMDIEGAEVLALRGASSALKRKKIKNMIIEYHTPKNRILIEKMLKNLGYKISIDARSIFYETEDFATGHIIATLDNL